MSLIQIQLPTSLIPTLPILQAKFVVVFHDVIKHITAFFLQGYEIQFSLHQSKIMKLSN